MNHWLDHNKLNLYHHCREFLLEHELEHCLSAVDAIGSYFDALTNDRIRTDFEGVKAELDIFLIGVKDDQKRKKEMQEIWEMLNVLQRAQNRILKNIGG